MKRQITALLAIAAAFAAGIVVAALTGCSSPPTYEFDELDSTPAQDELIEFSLGKYSIPIPLVPPNADGAGQKRNRLEFAFELHALVTSDYESQLAALWNRHEGTVRDRVILICRTAKLEELQEPELATLKSHLTDAIQAELGPKGIRRLLISEVVTQKL